MVGIYWPHTPGHTHTQGKQMCEKENCDLRWNLGGNGRKFKFMCSISVKPNLLNLKFIWYSSNEINKEKKIIIIN